MNTVPVGFGLIKKATGPDELVASLDSVDALDVKQLRGVARHVIDGGKALIDYVDYNREDARRAGIETLAVELSGILASRRLDDIFDSLQEASLSGNATKVSKEGLSYLRRAEKLLAEANATLFQITGASPIPGGYKLGANVAVELPMTGLIIAGALVAIGVVLAVILSKK